MAEVVRTNFTPIFSDFENFLRHWCTDRSATWRRFFKSVNPLVRAYLPLKTLQTSSKSTYKSRRYELLIEVIYYVTYTVELRQRDNEKHHTLSPDTDVRCSIFTKLYMMAEEVCVVI